MDEPVASPSAASGSTGEFQKVESQMSTLNPKGSPTEIPSSGIITDAPKFAEEERLAKIAEEKALKDKKFKEDLELDYQAFKMKELLEKVQQEAEDEEFDEASAALVSDPTPFIAPSLT